MADRIVQFSCTTKSYTAKITFILFHSSHYMSLCSACDHITPKVIHTTKTHRITIMSEALYGTSPECFANIMDETCSKQTGNANLKGLSSHKHTQQL